MAVIRQPGAPALWAGILACSALLGCSREAGRAAMSPPPAPAPASAQPVSAGGVAAANFDREPESSELEPLAALRLASAAVGDDERADLVVLVVARWAAIAPEAAVEWADRLADETLRGRALGAAVGAWAERSPVAAARLALAALPPGPAQDALVLRVVARWAQVEPEAAGAWVSAFPPGELRRAAGDALVARWMERDPVVCGNWVRTQAAGADGDAIVAGYVVRLAPAAAPAAATWVNAISDPSLRERAALAVGRAWLARDEAAAEAWLRQTSLPEQVRARLLALRHEFPPGESPD